MNKSYNAIKNKAKAAMQKWARMRDADKNGIIQCCCCGVLRNWKHSDGAHFIPATKLSTCFVEMNINACCWHCNRFLEGARVEYRDFMLKKYGQPALEELEKMQYVNKKYMTIELEAIAIMYKNKQEEFKWKNL